MINTTLPGYPLYMYKTDTDRYPRYSLPEGYRFAFFREGDERHWADIIHSLGFFAEYDAALAHFEKEFRSQALTPCERMLFILSPDGEYVATCTLWDGEYLGERHQRLHWLGVKDSHAGRGLARALLCRLLDLYRELGYRDFVYLITGAKYYPAVAIYRDFGFWEYRGEVEPGRENPNFATQNAISLEVLDRYLGKRGGEEA